MISHADNVLRATKRFPYFLKSEIATAKEERERKLTDDNRIHRKLNQIDYMR